MSAVDEIRDQALGERTSHDGTTDGRLLARAHPSGQWIEWLDTTPAS